MKTLLCMLIIVCSINLCQAQTDKKYEIGIHLGTLIYQGDLSPSAIGSFKTPGFILGINGSRELTESFSIRAELSFGKLKGDDAAYKNPEWRQQRNFAFKSSVVELAGMIVWEPVSHKKLSPYAFGGVGISFLNIKRDYSNFNTEYFSDELLGERLAIDASHSLPKAIPVFPLGIGIRYPLNDNFSLHLEGGYRYTKTDYMDGFSQAANPSKDDQYSKISIGINYSLNGRSKYGCPVIKY